MIIASDRTAARAYAGLLTKFTGEAPTVVLSDDPGSSARITAFRRAPADGWSRCAWSPKASTCHGCRSVSMPPARRRRCSSRRRSAGSCVRAGRAKPRASSCRRCPICCSWPASWRRSATTYWASRTAKPRAIRSTTIPPTKTQTEQGRGQRLRPPWAPTPNWIRSSSTAPRSAPPPPPEATRRPTTSASPACSTPNRCAPCCTARQDEQLQKRAGSRRDAGADHHPWPTARSAPRTQRAGVGCPPPHRQATRLDPQRAAPSLRRAPDRRGHPRSAQGPHRCRAAAQRRAGLRPAPYRLVADGLVDHDDRRAHPARPAGSFPPRIVRWCRGGTVTQNTSAAVDPKVLTFAHTMSVSARSSARASSASRPVGPWRELPGSAGLVCRCRATGCAAARSSG